MNFPLTMFLIVLDVVHYTIILVLEKFPQMELLLGSDEDTSCDVQRNKEDPHHK